MHGNIIKGPFWSEPVRVEKIEEIGNYIRIVGSTIHSKKYVNQIIKKEDTNALEIIKSAIDLSSNSENAFFVIEATRFKYASLFDPLLARLSLRLLVMGMKRCQITLILQRGLYQGQ